MWIHQSRQEAAPPHEYVGKFVQAWKSHVQQCAKSAYTRLNAFRNMRSVETQLRKLSFYTAALS